MKSVANAYINKRECSIQECAYHTLPGQWLRKTFPVVIFAKSNIPKKRFQLCLAEHQISELPEDSKKIFKRNMVDRYIDRPNLTSSSGKFAVLDAFCFAEFSRYYYLPSNPKYKESDYQPEELDDEIVEDISNSDYLYPKDIKLLLNEKKRHMFYSIIKKPNLYYPFRDKKNYSVAILPHIRVIMHFLD